MTTRRQFLAVAAAAVLAMGVTAPSSAQDLKEINFGIISTEAQSNLKQIWLPFLADMEKNTGMKVNAFFAPDYAGVIEGMRFNKVQLAWFGNASAIQAVDRAGGEVFVQTVAANGEKGYYSLIIAHKDSPVKSLEDVVKASGKLTFANGDPNSTSGFLIPSYFAWAQNNVDVRKHFTRMVTGSHETNALAVANKQVDIGTGNTENMDRLHKTAPEKFAQLKEIWRSPLIPSDPIVWRADLPASTKQTLKNFFVTYGTKQPGKSDAQQAQELGVLKALQWAPFVESSNKQLIPVREVALFRDKLKIEQDDKLSADEKAAKVKEIDAKLADLRKMIGS